MCLRFLIKLEIERVFYFFLLSEQIIKGRPFSRTLD